MFREGYALKKAIICVLLAALLLGGTANADEVFDFSIMEEMYDLSQWEEVFDENEWEEVPAIASVNDLRINVPSAILMEKETGTIIFEHNAHERLAPASVTKIMTMLLVVEALENGSIKLSDKVTTSAHAASMGGSQIYLEEGEQMTVEDMLKSVAIASANDASVALAEHIAGSEEAFVRRMNDRARELGMEHTVFSNSTGLPTEGEHLTCAYDIALMSRELISHDIIKKYTTIWMDTVRNGEFGLGNTNKLVRFYKGATGLKTGFTREAMYCLAATAERDGVEYIAVVMHAETSDIRFESAKALLNHAFSTYTLVDVVPPEALAPIPVVLGEVKYMQPVLKENRKLLIEKMKVSQLVKQVELVESIEAPVAAGQELGKLTIRDGEQNELAVVPIVSDNQIKRLSWGQIFFKYLRILFLGDL
jgi:D-alanyl-D-alanine carboxypeptidase (penicillin-binding protein 5/6)